MVIGEWIGYIFVGICILVILRSVVVDLFGFGNKKK
jgi:hypothetical protein